MPVPSLCCCGCTIFSDDFARTTALLDPDEVNVLGQTRYSFTPGDWYVAPLDSGATGDLVAATGSSPIRFRTGTPTLFNVAVDVNLPVNGDWCKLIFDSHEVVLTRVSGSERTLTLEGGTITLSGSGIINIAFWTRTSHAYFFDEFASADMDLISSGNGFTFGGYTKRYYGADIGRAGIVGWDAAPIDASAGFSDWYLDASPGVRIRGLTVTQSGSACQHINHTCGSPVKTGLASLALAIAGMQDWSGTGETDCDMTWLNDTFILDRRGDASPGCLFKIQIAPTGGLGDCFLEGEIGVVSFTCEDAGASPACVVDAYYIDITVPFVQTGAPFSSPGNWTTGPITRAAIEAGTPITMQPGIFGVFDAVTTIYADQVYCTCFPGCLDDPAPSHSPISLTVTPVAA